MDNFPETTTLAVSRKGTFEFNELALQALFPRREPLACLDGDIESNPANYDGGALLRDHTKLKSYPLRIYMGMRVYLTRNVIKGIDYVNGMLAIVEGYNEETRALRVLTNTGHHIELWRWTDRELSNRSYYPVRPGYCSTIIKFQGAELKHVTLHLDTPGIPGAAYTALSRVATSKQYLIGGNVNPHHFTPVRAGLYKEDPESAVP